LAALAALGLATLTGCDVPAACETDSTGTAPSVSAKPLVTTTTLEHSGEILSMRVRATLSNLPELWQDSGNIVGGHLTVTLALAYQSSPVGGDGKTQMPRLSGRLSLANVDDGVDIDTSEFQAGSASAKVDAFRVCQGGDQLGCCKFGQRSCSLPLVFSIQRRDGDPFPPVDATITIGAEAEVTRCPIDDHEQASLVLTAE
jgi:hypothetical protein